MTVRDSASLLTDVSRRLLICAAKVYQAMLSPLLGGQCRFVPTCSQYFIEAVDTHGAWLGGLMGLRRVLRCHPLAPGGCDPVDSR